MMVARRLSDSQKRKLVQSFCDGETLTNLALENGCSPNTVSRTVKASLTAEEYTAVKIARSKGETSLANSLKVDLSLNNQIEVVTVENNHLQDHVDNSIASKENMKVNSLDIDDSTVKNLALDDADDFNSDQDEQVVTEDDFESQSSTDTSINHFQELVPLDTGLLLSESENIECKSLAPGILPDTVYMLVDKTIELDARPLSDFPELGRIQNSELDLKAISIFSNPRSAKRQCGRSQRVIKIPDTSVFEISVPYLLSRGITRLVLEGTLISLDK